MYKPLNVDAMRVFLRAASYALISLTLAAAAHAIPYTGAPGREMPRWYAQLGGSISFLDDYSTRFINDVHYFSTSSFKFKTGYAIRGNVGYMFSPYLSAELELARYGNSVDKQRGVNVSAIPAGGSSAPQNALAIMANGYARYPNRTLFTPYIGAGGGMLYIDTPLYAPIKDGSGNVIESKDLKDWVLAYQFMAGLAYELPDNPFGTPSEIILGYRYLHGDDGEVKFSSIPGYGVRFQNVSHNIDLGWRLYF